jgi:hypothetical protein
MLISKPQGFGAVEDQCLRPFRPIFLKLSRSWIPYFSEESYSFSPSVRATKRAQQLSLNTFTAVRNISKIRSTAKIRATPSAGKPRPFKTTIIDIKEAEGTPATPIEATKVKERAKSCVDKGKGIP